jgi:hypothetical protein
MSGDLFELLFVIAFILFGILGGRKKKRPGAGQQQLPRPRPRLRPAPRPAPERFPGARRPPPATPQTPKDALLRELEGLLTGQRPAPVEVEPAWVPASSDRVPDPDEARSLESLEDEGSAAWEEGLEQASDIRDTPGWAKGRDREAGTLETLEEAGETSHQRFHERYAIAPRAESRAPRGPIFDIKDIRRAIVWSEILGPPVSLR